MKRLIRKAYINTEEIQQGDYVDFGPYGKMYVCNTDYSIDYFWVTDDEENRANPNSSGWSIRKSDAINIIEEYEEEDF